jgi:D-alanyl-D-alanine carboxypeptidase
VWQPLGENHDTFDPLNLESSYHPFDRRKWCNHMNRRPNPSIFNWLATLLIAVLALTGCSDGSDGKGHNTPPPEALVSLAQDVSRANGGRAAILHVTTAEGKTWEVAAGLADANAEREAKSSDIVEIGSISKVFLAATVLRLVERGLLGLDDPVSQWINLADLDALTGGNGALIRLRHLLNHSTGMGDYLNFSDDDNVVLETYGITGDTVFAPQELIDRTIDLTEQPVAGGKTFPVFTLQDYKGESYPDYDALPISWYSNTHYVMLGLIVEAVTGERYEDIIRQEVIESLGLKDTSFGTDGVRADLRGYALGLAASGENPVTMSPTLSWAAGQTLSTVADLAIFVGALYKGELFDRAETLELWKNQYFKPLQGEVPYGLGIMRFDLYGPEAGVFYGHDGQVLGAVALMAYHVETGDVYTAAVNNSQYRSVDSGEGGSTWELAPKLRQIADANR